LVLSAIEELNSREVGILLEIPEGTVRTRLKQAREELRRRFDAANRSRR
jgi:RNA polymerase sigma-70 factor (ECF subfamily)